MKRTIFRSIRFKLIFFYILILALFITLSDIILYEIFRKSQIESIDRTLYAAAEEVKMAIMASTPESWPKQVKQLERDFTVNRFFINIYEIQDGYPKPLAINPRGVPGPKISTNIIQEFLKNNQLNQPQFKSLSEETPDWHPLRIIIFPVDNNPAPSHVVEVGTSLKKANATLKNFRLILFIFAPVLLILTSLGSFFILSRALIPVGQVVETARSITAEDLSLRIKAGDRNDEIGDLIETFNDMIDRLEKSVEQIKHFSSEVSHELRTPLTIIRGEIEITLRKERKKSEYVKVLKSVNEEAVKLQKMVSSLLFLSHIITRENEFRFERISLDEILLRSFEQCESLARKKQINLIINRIDPAEIMGEETLVNRMIVNILDNAIKYTPPGGTVEIALEKKKNHILLTISDSGIGISKKDLPWIFDRFYKAEVEGSGKQDGLGVGLSIVKRIVDMMGASINIQSHIHRGTTVKIYLPLITSRSRRNPSRANIKNF